MGSSRCERLEQDCAGRGLVELNALAPLQRCAAAAAAAPGHLAAISVARCNASIGCHGLQGAWGLHGCAGGQGATAGTELGQARRRLQHPAAITAAARGDAARAASGPTPPLPLRRAVSTGGYGGGPATRDRAHGGADPLLASAHRAVPGRRRLAGRCRRLPARRATAQLRPARTRPCCP